MVMIKAIIAFALLVQTCHSWVLRSTHNEVHVNITTNVTFECRYDNDDNGKIHMAEIDRITIHKYKEKSSWITYAKIHDGDSEPLVFIPNSDVTAEGHAEKAGNSFLTVTWSTGSRDTIGQFACEVDGFAANDVAVNVITNPLTVSEIPLGFNDLLIKRIEETSRDIRENYNNMLMIINSRFDDLSRDIKTLRNDCQICSNKNKIVFDAKNWPGGSYALLNTDAGCPNSPTGEWAEGYIRVHSESHFNSDTVWNPNHLAKPVLEQINGKHFFFIQTCKHVTQVLQPAWPRGSYCIHRVDGSCPSEFKEGAVNLDMEDVSTEKEDKNPPDITYINNGLDLQLHFCCRNDGSPDIPIGLPVDKPFYLYRFKGRCQQVSNANTTEEGFVIDVEDDNQSTFVRQVNDIHPDSKPPRFIFCYYEKNIV